MTLNPNINALLQNGGVYYRRFITFYMMILNLYPLIANGIENSQLGCLLFAMEGILTWRGRCWVLP